VDGLLGIDLALHFPDKIDQAGILRNFLVAAPVAQDVVDFLQRFFVIAAVALVSDGEVFVGVNVMQRDCTGIAVRDRVL
jgi:hypothetical protein